MFTGLIQTVGKVTDISKKNDELRLRVSPQKGFDNFILGESIAVNGVCLTVESFDKGSFLAFASSETISLTNLGLLSRGSKVNLERALKMGDSLGGHLVSGHVDAICTVLSVVSAGSSSVYTFEFPIEFSRHIIAKGSVAVDGISLTVNTVVENTFTVNVIPATAFETTISDWKKGSKINLETDLIGKYVEKMFNNYLGQEKPSSTKVLDLDFFKGHGF